MTDILTYLFSNNVPSEVFITFWVLIVASVIFVPFGFYGIIRFYRWIDNNFLKSRAGFMKIRQKQTNGRWRTFWVKPSGAKIKLKSEEGKFQQDVPIETTKDFMGFEGNVPFAEFDENLIQMRLDRTSVVIPKEHQTRMSYLAYLAGKIAGMSEGINLQLLLIIGIGALLGIAGYMAYTTYNFQNTVGEQLTSMTDSVGQLKSTVALINATLPKIPVV
jgi:hypothetical protein